MDLNPPKSTPQKAFIKINCPACDTEVSAANLSLPDKLGKCQACNAVFPIADAVAALQQSPKSIVQKPVGIDKFEFQDELDFKIKKPYTGSIGLAGIIIFTFAVPLFLILFYKGKIGMMWPIVSAALFGLSILEVTKRQKDEIDITINSYNLDIRFRPNNFSKDKSFAVNEIDQLYVKPYGDGKHFSLYAIINKLEGQKHVKLIGMLNERAKAKYLEQEIENHLGIIDRHVPESEIPPPPLQIVIGG
ncbi:MAG: hypothetical protein AAF960_18275 [Bacteroidota bacterium]